MEQLLDEDKRVCLQCRSRLAFHISRFGCLFACRCHAQVIDGQKAVSAYYDRLRNPGGQSPLLPFVPVIELGSISTSDVAAMKAVSVEVSCLERKAAVFFRNFSAAEVREFLDALPHALKEQVESIQSPADIVMTATAYDSKVSAAALLPLGVMDSLLSELQAAAATLDSGFLLTLPPPQIQSSIDSMESTCNGSSIDDATSIASRLPALLGKTLRGHQLEAIRQALRWGGRALIADEMGTGKTLAALGIVAATHRYPLLIVAPSALKFMWAEEVEKFLYEQVSLDDIHIINGSNDALVADPRDTPKVVITSYHMAATLHQQLSARIWGCLVVDESHILHTNVGMVDARYTQLLVSLGKASDHCVLLSGTPALTSPFDMFNQIDMLRPGLLGETRWHFALRYCRVRMAPYPQLLECTRPLEFSSLLRSLCMVRRLKQEVLELPAKNRIALKVSSNADRDDRKTDGGGSFQYRYSQCWRLKRRGIFEAVSYTCDKYPAVVLFAHHLALLNELASFLSSRKTSFIRVDGGVDPQTRGPLISQFDRGEVKVALVGITACAVGISLASAHCALFCELPPDAAWMQQAEDRLHRFGQISEVSVYYLVGINSLFDAKHFAELCNSFARVRDITDGEGEVLTLGHTSRTAPQGKGLPALRCRTSAREALVREGCNDAVTSFSAPLVFRISKHTHRIHVKAKNAEDGGSHPPVMLYASFSHEEANLCIRERSSPVWEQLSEYVERLQRLSPFQQRLLINAEEWLPASFMWERCTQQGTVSGKRTRYQQESVSPLLGSAPSPGTVGWGFWWKVGRPGFPVRFYFASLAADTSASMPSTSAAFTPRCLNCRRPLPHDVTAAARASPGSVVEVTGDTSMFCRGTCREAFFARRSSGAIRSSVRRADRGVCTYCQVDCEALCIEVRAACSRATREALVRKQLPHLENFPTLFRNFVEAPTPGNVWHADHIVPVALGGGEAGLENIQTLCVACHALKTQEDLKRIRRRPAGPNRGPVGTAAPGTTVEVALLKLMSGTQMRRATWRS